MATIFIVGVCYGFPSLYATLVCVACSQLEKIRLALLDIGHTYPTSLQYCGGESDEREAAGQKNTLSEQFRHMQEQLIKYIRQHQEIKR